MGSVATKESLCCRAASCECKMSIVGVRKTRMRQTRHRHQSCRSTTCCSYLSHCTVPRWREGRGPQCQLVDSGNYQARKAVASTPETMSPIPEWYTSTCPFRSAGAMALDRMPVHPDTSSGPACKRNKLMTRNLPTSGSRRSLVFTSDSLSRQLERV